MPILIEYLLIGKNVDVEVKTPKRARYMYGYFSHIVLMQQNVCKNN
jgi:hypothetical protein